MPFLLVPVCMVDSWLSKNALTNVPMVALTYRGLSLNTTRRSTITETLKLKMDNNIISQLLTMLSSSTNTLKAWTLENDDITAGPCFSIRTRSIPLWAQVYLDIYYTFGTKVDHVFNELCEVGEGVSKSLDRTTAFLEESDCMDFARDDLTWLWARIQVYCKCDTVEQRR